MISLFLRILSIYLNRNTFDEYERSSAMRLCERAFICFGFLSLSIRNDGSFYRNSFVSAPNANEMHIITFDGKRGREKRKEAHSFGKKTIHFLIVSRFDCNHIHKMATACDLGIWLHWCHDNEFPRRLSFSISKSLFMGVWLQFVHSTDFQCWTYLITIFVPLTSSFDDNQFGAYRLLTFNYRWEEERSEIRKKIDFTGWNW